MSRETYETYSAEPEKIDLIAFLAEYFQAFRKFFLGVLILVILMGGGSFLTAKLRYQLPHNLQRVIHFLRGIFNGKAEAHGGVQQFFRQPDCLQRMAHGWFIGRAGAAGRDINSALL